MNTLKFRQPLFQNGKDFSQFHYWGFDDEKIFTAPCGNLNEKEKDTGSNQFTGLADKFGIDIFDGDILRGEEPDSATFVCIFDKGSYLVEKYINGQKETGGGYGLNPINKRLIVRGNIYQNMKPI